MSWTPKAPLVSGDRGDRVAAEEGPSITYLCLLGKEAKLLVEMPACGNDATPRAELRPKALFLCPRQRIVNQARTQLSRAATNTRRLGGITLHAAIDEDSQLERLRTGQVWQPSCIRATSGEAHVDGKATPPSSLMQRTDSRTFAPSASRRCTLQRADPTSSEPSDSWLLGTVNT
jgi:hypothetical protein